MMNTHGGTTSFKINGLQCYIHQPAQDLHPDVAVVTVHQCSALGGCALAVEDVASSCAAQGMLTISFDLRGAGSRSGVGCCKGVLVITCTPFL